MRAYRVRWVLVFIAVSVILAGLTFSGIGQTTLAQGDDPTPTLFYEINDDPELNASMDHVEEATGILRGLEPLESVTRAFMSRDDLVAYLADTLDEDYPPELARDDAIFYHAFGFMDLDTDLQQVQLDVLAEQIAGFYDPELDAMFVISSNDQMSGMDQIIYAHEFTHTLQDQHFDLVAMGIDEELLAASPDAFYAVLSLVEGDAMLMTEGYQMYMMRSNPGSALGILVEGLLISAEALNAAPPIMQAELLFPYTAGRNFVYILFVAGDGWDMVNDAYANPPQTTEQILHPERYVIGEEAVQVPVAPLDDVLGEGWRLVWDRTLGEFYLREHLRAETSRQAAAAAAAGWGGDRYHVYFNDETEETVLVWRIVWDSFEDGDEFAATYRGYGVRRFDEPGTAVNETDVCWFGKPTLCYYPGEGETLILLVPDQAMLADVLPTQPQAE